MAAATATLQSFVDDELLRAPLVAQQLLDETLHALADSPPGAGPTQRSLQADLAQALRHHAPRMVAEYTASLRQQTADEMSRSGANPAPTPTADRAAPQWSGELSLVDEAAIASDVEISHTIEAIKSVAEYELRELATFTSALVGDMDVAHDHNPLRAETQARALWAAAGLLPLSKGFQVAFMRHAATPLARVLRKAYAAACTRLEEAGVAPALYRTMILPGGARSGRNGRTLTDQALRAIGEHLASSDSAANVSALLTASHSDGRYLELLSHLFDYMLADERLPRDVGAVISRLQASALRVALRDPRLLEAYDHPLWEFINAIAAQADLLPEAPNSDRASALQQVEALVDQIAREPQQDADLYHSARERLLAYERDRVEARAGRHAGQIAALAAVDVPPAGRPAPAAASASAIDVEQLDTVPAALLDDQPATQPGTPAADEWLAALLPGSAVRLFLQGHWVHAQLLWCDAARELWLWADCHSDAAWPIRRGALRLLRTERLAARMAHRSLIRDAAERMATQLARSQRT